ncbi:type II toxin-antitoxin system RelE/ParE family toxin [Azorhizobium sp. AG788]|uniref:type II toxin-antitoxin system RelE/ParE family toxin n=1 Tax=Azorhizobium sp. AG788 TaxID=2183897 RepID=UPI00313895A5
MRRLRYLAAARRDLIAIFEFIAEQNDNPLAARRFTERLRARCRLIADTPGLLGTARPELHPDIRSFASQGYVIFFRYIRDALEIVGIIEGHRDMARWSQTLPGATDPAATPEEE